MAALESNDTYDEQYALPRRVLSVQSHVVSGYVGNKAAVFPLQILGFDCDYINTVQFSNHTGYPLFKGTVTTGDQLIDIANGLKANNLLDYDYLLTGYIGSESFLDSVLDLLNMIESSFKSNIKYICDPVLGDEGKCYVPASLVSIFVAKVIPRAYMITPNQFEAELLTGMKIKSNDDVIEALKKLNALGPKIVVMTSAEIDEKPNQLCCYVLVSDSNTKNGNTNSIEITRIIVNKIDGYFTGTGDCCAALLLGWCDKLGESNMGIALKNTLGTIQAIINKTIIKQRAMDAKINETTNEIDKKALKARAAELNVIQCKDDILNPPDIICTSISSIVEDDDNAITTWTL